MFDSPTKLLLGLITGIAFGFLLQKGQAAKYRVIMGQFLLKDWTVVKIMLTAVVVGSLGVWALVSLGAATLHIKAAAMGESFLVGFCLESVSPSSASAREPVLQPAGRGTGMPSLAYLVCCLARASMSPGILHGSRSSRRLRIGES